MLIFYFCLHTDEEDYDPFGNDPYGYVDDDYDSGRNCEDNYDSGRPHRSDLCEKCKKLGHNCAE